MVALPFLGSTNVNTERRPAIMLGKSPERDRDIEDIHRCIAALAAVGIPAFKYNMSILGVTRTAPNAWPRQLHVQHVQRIPARSEFAADNRRHRYCGYVLGAY